MRQLSNSPDHCKVDPEPHMAAAWMDATKVERMTRRTCGLVGPGGMRWFVNVCDEPEK